jgi:CRP/FNR family transcriptional regulator, cyclic AMP receptor protein
VNWGEVAGWTASVLVFATFYMKTMLPLRLVGMASNIAFITYSLIGGLTPVLILHTALLPLNALRYLQLRELSRKVETAARVGNFSVEAILPLMRRRRIAAGETLFRAGDPAGELYYILEGTIFLPAVQQAVGPGHFLGEFGLFSEAGMRTGSAIAQTDGAIMVLTRSAVFACLLQRPHLGVHLLRLITTRMLQNAGLTIPPPEPTSELPSPGKPADRRSGWQRFIAGRTAPRLAIAIVSIGLLVAVFFQPLYVVFDRNAAVTSWLNQVTAPVTGTVEGFEAKAGQRIEDGSLVARIENHSADRSGVIRAEGAVRRAEARVVQLALYNDRLATLVADWADRKGRYGSGFAHDLDLKMKDLERRASLLKERVTLAEVSASRRRTLRAAGTGSQADEDVARSNELELHARLDEVVEALERLRHRRRLAEEGVFIQEDGKEPEWSWRSLDEMHLEGTRTARMLSEAREELATATAVLAEEKRNFEAASRALIRIPPGMTLWSSAVSTGTSVKQGDPMFTWIDCSTLLVDAPVTETLAALLAPGVRAEVILEGETAKREATVWLTRGAASRLGRLELASLSRDHRRGTAQALVSLVDPGAIQNCPIGRRAFVTFPDIRLWDYVRAYMSM